MHTGIIIHRDGRLSRRSRRRRLGLHDSINRHIIKLDVRRSDGSALLKSTRRRRCCRGNILFIYIARFIGSGGHIAERFGALDGGDGRFDGLRLDIVHLLRDGCELTRRCTRRRRRRHSRWLTRCHYCMMVMMSICGCWCRSSCCCDWRWVNSVCYSNFLTLH